MEYAVEPMQLDEAGLQFYLTKYKPFRLGALQTAPTFFGSTYAREVSMPDDFWRDRLMNPRVRTFVAVRSDTKDILSSVSIVSGIPVSPGLKFKIGLEAEGDNDNAEILHWGVSGVYTAPEARRRGVSKAVMAGAMDYARDAAASAGKALLMTVVVKNDNYIARNMYEKMGFAVVGDGEEVDTQLLFLWKSYKR